MILKTVIIVRKGVGWGSGALERIVVALKLMYAVAGGCVLDRCDFHCGDEFAS